MIENLKKRKVSKKNKKSWRKNVDIKDVDKFLDNKRLEERLGAPFSERADSELFSIDTSRDETLLVSKIERRAQLKIKEPRCFAILKPHTAVSDPISKRNRVKTPEERKNPIRRKIENEMKRNGILKLRERISLKDRSIAKEKRNKRYKRGEFKEDIWEKEGNVPAELNSGWFTSDTIRHTLANTGRKRKRVPESLIKKPSALPAVQVPHPGTSYNPSFNDHQDLLREVAEKQLQFEKEEAHLNRVTNQMFKKISSEEKDRNTLKEMSEGLPLNLPVEKSDNHGDEDTTVKSVNPPTKNEKKTLQKRRKQKEERQMKLQRKQNKIEKKKVADIYKLKLIHKQMESKEKEEKLTRERREAIKEKQSVEPKVLSRIKFEASEPDFKLGAELTGNLRNAEPVGSLLKDRYKSLQQRNIVAPGALVLKHTKPNVKKYIKPDHKINCSAK